MFAAYQDVLEEDCRRDDTVALLGEYLTSMSMGRPQLLKDFLINCIVPW